MMRIPWIFGNNGKESDTFDKRNKAAGLSIKSFLFDTAKAFICLAVKFCTRLDRKTVGCLSKPSSKHLTW